MKNKMKKAPVGAKAVSIIMILCMLFSLTACNGGNSGNSGNSSSQHGAGISTRDDQEITQIPGPGIDEPHQEIDPGANIAEPTDEPVATSEPAQNGKYSYTLYGRTISMDVNVDDYFFDNKGVKCFDIYELATSLGWSSDSDTGSSGHYMFQNGDMVISMSIDYNLDVKIPGTNYGQLSSIGYGFGTTDGGQYYNESGDNLSHRSFFLSFGAHVDTANCRLFNPNKCGLSYDDVVLISYILWSGITNPGESPMMIAFGEDFEYIYSRTTSMSYHLP